MVIALSALLIGLACGYTIKGENAYSACVRHADGCLCVRSHPGWTSCCPAAQIAPSRPGACASPVITRSLYVTMPTAAWLNIAGWRLSASFGASHMIIGASVMKERLISGVRPR